MVAMTNARAALMVLAIGLATPTSSVAQSVDTQSAARMKILVHVTHGPEDPTRAALAFLVAKTAIDEGQSVTIFLAGDAVQLIRGGVLDSLAGLGTGRLRDHYDAIVKGGGRFYLSGMSSTARSVTAEDLKGKPAEFAQPNVLIRLALEHDRVITY